MHSVEFKKITRIVCLSILISCDIITQRGLNSLFGPLCITLRKNSRAVKVCKGCQNQEGRWGTWPLQFWADHLSLSPLGDQIVLTRIPRFSELPTFLLPSRGYKFQRLDPNLSGLAERAGMAASCMYVPALKKPQFK